MLYLALIESALSDAARKAFEMTAQTERRMSSWQRDSFEKGEASGIAKGEASGVAKGVVAVLEARGLAVTDNQRERILGCSDLAQLDRWLRLAATVDQATRTVRMTL